MKEFIGKTKNGCSVYVDTVHSHASTHLKDTPGLLELTEEALDQLELTEEKYWFDIDMSRVIGTSECVETHDGDEILYAQRPNRDNFSRFVKNRKPEPTNYLSLWLEKRGENEYELMTTYIGRKTPSFPGGKSETPESFMFWADHALIWGNQEIVSGTETTICPW